MVVGGWWFQPKTALPGSRIGCELTRRAARRSVRRSDPPGRFGEIDGPEGLASLAVSVIFGLEDVLKPGVSRKSSPERRVKGSKACPFTTF